VKLVFYDQQNLEKHMSNSQIPNHFSWSELMTSDPKAATEFYGSLFGWQFDAMNIGEEAYQIATNNDVQIAGIMQMPEGMTSPGWGQYVTVSDIEASAEKVKALGGVLLTPPTQIPGIGKFIVFQDPQGAVLSAIQYETSDN
jgi:predicted enzyme related to lactoylglutathione lyase